MLQKERFVIYRPPKPTNRLEDFQYKLYGQWAPSIKYSYNLWDIRNQMTPAESYRHRLATSGKMIRVLQRLEWRWQKSFQLWWDITIRVQCVFRGMLARRYFKSVKTELRRVKEQREAKLAVVKKFIEGDKKGALLLINNVEAMSIDLWTIKIKILFSTQKYKECQEVCKIVLEIDSRCEEAHFALSCIYARENLYVDAYKQLKQLMSSIDEPSAEAFRLNGLVCTKLIPPKLAEAADSCNMLVAMYPEDMNALLQRACVLASAQDWDLALKDFNMILMYQPNLPNVRCLRARTYCAVREWDKARKDYQDVLDKYPEDHLAWYGLADTNQAYDPQPMVDHDLVNDAALPY